ncbi:MAG: OmpH family outer membrane protein [Bacteroidota bacterium]
MLRIIYLSLAFLLGSWTLNLSPLAAQGGIGIIDLDLVLQLMPETQTMQQELQIFERQKIEELQPLTDSVKKRRQQIEQQAQKGVSRETLQPYIDELTAMQQRLRTRTEAAQEASAYRESLFLEEIRNKFDRHLAELCEEQNFTYVFNGRASGNSVMLKTLDGANLTRALLLHMNVPLADESDARDE